MAVHRGVRRQSVGRLLLARAIRTLEADAAADGAQLRAVFGEVNDPARVQEDDDLMNGDERLETLDRMGARRVPMPYVQPQLRPGQGGLDRCSLSRSRPTRNRSELFRRKCSGHSSPSSTARWASRRRTTILTFEPRSQASGTSRSSCFPCGPHHRRGNDVRTAIREGIRCARRPSTWR